MTSARRPSRARAIISHWRRRCWRRRHRVWWRSAGCRAPASRSLRARWRRSCCRRPARCCSQRRRAQGDVRHARDRAFAADRLHARGHRARLCGASPRRRAASSPPAIRRSWMRSLRDLRNATAIERAAGRAEFHGLFLTAELDLRLSRVGSRQGDASDADANVARAQERYDLGALDWAGVDASGTPAETLRRARARTRDCRRAMRCAPRCSAALPPWRMMPNQA